MATRYYRVREKKHPDQMGTVVKVKNGKLEFLTVSSGEPKPKSISIGPRGGLKIAKKYSAQEISKSRAYEIKNDFINYEGLVHITGGRRVGAN